MRKLNFKFFQLPSNMRPAYLQNLSDHFLRKQNLFYLFKYFFKTISDRQIKFAIEESLVSAVIEEILSKQSEINGNLCRWKLIFLRTLVLLAKPEIVVETGVAHGSSSAVILEALDQNRQGRLYSVDLPVILSLEGQPVPMFEGHSLERYSFKAEDVPTTVPSVDRVGWLVPSYLRNRWNLSLENSLTELPKITQDLSHIDIFLHDSLHTYEHMISEFEMVWPYLKEGGFLLADDIFIQNHLAIYDFARRNHQEFKTYLQIGIIGKS